MGEAVAGPSRLQLRGSVNVDGTSDGRAASTPFRPEKRNLQRLPLQVVASEAAPTSEAYASLDHPRHALKLLCYDVHALQTQRCPGSVRTFLHYKRPTLFAHIVGRIVGVEQRESKVMWLVDDGTAVVAVHYTLNKRPVVQAASASRTSDKGKRKARDDETAELKLGIPKQYIRPQTPPRLASVQADFVVEKSVKDEKYFVKSIDHLTVCILVSVVGRVDSRFREHVIVVDRVIPRQAQEDDSRFRGPRDGFIVLVEDINEEAKHALSAVDLADCDYSTILPCDVSKPKDRRMSVLGEWNARQNELPKEFSSVKRLLQSDECSLRDVNKSPSSKGSLQKAILASTTSFRTERALSSRRQSRRLRDYRKLSEHELTEHLLRIYVQKHLIDHCKEAPTKQETDTNVVCVSDSSSDEDQPQIKRRATSHARGLSTSVKTKAAALASPAFALEYLLRVKNLYGLARRIVAVEQKRREKRRLRAGRSSVINAKNEADVIQRLFEVVVRHIAADGMIVLADAATVNVQSPFDGRKPAKDHLRRLDPDCLLFWDEYEAEEGEDLHRAKHSAPDADHSFARWRDGGQRKVDVYQLVTPALLAPVVLSVLGVDAVHESGTRKTGKRLGTTKRSVDGQAKSTGRRQAPLPTTSLRDRYYAARIHHALCETSIEHVASRVRTQDDRWQRIREDSIAECFAYLQETYPME